LLPHSAASPNTTVMPVSTGSRRAELHNPGEEALDVLLVERGS
jgi:hypothetical protein